MINDEKLNEGRLQDRELEFTNENTLDYGETFVELFSNVTGCDRLIFDIQWRVNEPDADGNDALLELMAKDKQFNEQYKWIARIYPYYDNSAII